MRVGVCSNQDDHTSYPAMNLLSATAVSWTNNAAVSPLKAGRSPNKSAKRPRPNETGGHGGGAPLGSVDALRLRLVGRTRG
jgi:hypothetical protein